MEAAHTLINESGLKIFSIDDLQNAAEKSVQFSKVVKMGMSTPPTPFLEI
jgi:succinyl-CoA synthetase beta subunit